MRKAWLRFALVACGAGPLTLPSSATASGPDVYATVNYISTKLAQLSPASSIDMGTCDIDITFPVTDGVGQSLGTLEFNIPMNRVNSASVSTPPSIDIESWENLPDFFTTQSEGGIDQMTSRTSTVSIPLNDDNAVSAQRLANAINHLAKLCGSVDPNSAQALDPNDPFK